MPTVEVMAILPLLYGIEVRQDLGKFTDRELKKLLEIVPNAIFTFRRTSRQKPETLRRNYMNAIKLGYKFLDIDMVEMGEMYPKVKKHDARLIVSYHNFENTPTSKILKNTIEKIKERYQPYLTKIACQAHNDKDVKAVLNLYNGNENLLAIAMGALAKHTRMEILELGAPFTYIALNQDSPTAEGQYTLEEVIKI